jgi:serine/threonine protein kinase
MKTSSGVLEDKYSIPLNQWAAKKITMSGYCLSLIRKLNPTLGHNLPHTSIYSTKQGLFEHTKAVRGTPLSLKDSEGLYLLTDFVTALSQLSVPESEMEDVCKRFDIRETLSSLAKKHGLRGELRNLLQKGQIIHGDLNRGNIFLSRLRPRRLAIIDFEHAKIGPGVLNWYDFLLRNLVILGGRYPIKTDVVLQRCYKLPGTRKANPLLSEMTRQFLDACNVPRALHGPLIILYMSYLFQDAIVTEPEIVIKTVKSMDLRV